MFGLEIQIEVNIILEAYLNETYFVGNVFVRNHLLFCTMKQYYGNYELFINIKHTPMQTRWILIKTII